MRVVSWLSSTSRYSSIRSLDTIARMDVGCRCLPVHRNPLKTSRYGNESVSKSSFKYEVRARPVTKGPPFLPTRAEESLGESTRRWRSKPRGEVSLFCQWVIARKKDPSAVAKTSVLRRRSADVSCMASRCGSYLSRETWKQIVCTIALRRGELRIWQKDLNASELRVAHGT